MIKRIAALLLAAVLCLGGMTAMGESLYFALRYPCAAA